MSDTSARHRADAPESVRCAVVTISDTRTKETDRGGKCAVDLLAAAGHEIVGREVVPDEPDRIRAIVDSLRGGCDAILMTGGTGIGSRDRTYETVSALLTTTLPGFGELFRALSYQEIGPAAMLSRATAGLVGRTVVIAMPGSPAAVRLAVDQLVLPELGHLVAEARK